MSHYAVTDPMTDETIAQYPTITDRELADAVTSAAAAHRDWAQSMTTDQRAALVSRVADLHTERREELARIIVREMGKPIAQALEEVDFCAAIYQYYADHGPGFLADQPVEPLDGDGSAVIRHSAIGVLLGIMPWNFPYYQVARFAAPNLVIGNTVLLKHAPQCPESASALQQLFADAGLPDGVYTNIFATNEQVAELIADPRVRGVSLTGSERAGTAVAQQAGRNLKKVVLELGGSDPFIVLSTDDIDALVQAAIDGRLDNSGQSCNAAKRFIVTDELFDSFMEQFQARFLAVQPTDPSSTDTVLGPMSSRTAADRLQEQVDRAVAQGATIAATGERAGNLYPPTILTDISPDSDAYREEFFGPVASVFRVASEEEAVAVANDTPFGLGSYLFTTDPAQADRVADRLEAGMVFINAVGAEGPELMFGGVKRSGFGRELGHPGIQEFVNKKLIRIAG